LTKRSKSISRRLRLSWRLRATSERSSNITRNAFDIRLEKLSARDATGAPLAQARDLSVCIFKNIVISHLFVKVAAGRLYGVYNRRNLTSDHPVIQHYTCDSAAQIGLH